MKATLQFRWLVVKNHVTVELVKAYREEHDVSLADAKLAIAQELTPVFQQWHEAEGWEHDDYVKAGGEWQTIPTVVLSHEDAAK